MATKKNFFSLKTTPSEQGHQWMTNGLAILLLMFSPEGHKCYRVTETQVREVIINSSTNLSPVT